MRFAPTAFLACLAALIAPARAAPPEGRPPGLEVRSGRVAEVDWGDRRLTILGPTGRFQVGFDRNTVVYLPERLGTLRDVAPGAEVRTVANPDGVAAWIEVRPTVAGGGALAAPDGGAPGGAGPDGGAAAAADGGAPAGSDGGEPGGDPGRPDGGGALR
ncbi:MAG TPA: hypothetical protein VFR85_13190 [Anaeromyxobacteraceae bacterium]|nr:hypothetical protein [Anaeromyxobacteraceae bacterium]